MDLSLIIMQLLSGIALGAVLVITALGLTIVFGMLGVVNFAHGALFMIGAYAGLYLASLTGSFWWGLLLAPILIGAFGMLIELVLIRRLYGRSIDDPLLLTFGLSYILVEGVRIVFGSDGIPFPTPPQLIGVLDLGIGFFPRYRLFVIALVAVVLLVLWLALEKTRIGLIVRAAPAIPPSCRCSALISAGSGLRFLALASDLPRSVVCSRVPCAASIRRWARWYWRRPSS